MIDLELTDLIPRSDQVSLLHLTRHPTNKERMGYPTNNGAPTPKHHRDYIRNKTNMRISHRVIYNDLPLCSL